MVLCPMTRIHRTKKKRRNDAEPSPGTNDAWRRLAAAVVSHAAEDALEGDTDAAAWLASETAEMFCSALELDWRRIRIYAENWQYSKPPAAGVEWRISDEPLQVEIC